jgi:PAS domain S-box-containing protein
MALNKVTVVGSWELNPNNSSVSASSETKEMLDMDVDSTPSLQEIIQCYSPSYQNKIAEAIENCKKNGVTYDLECLITTFKGNNKKTRSVIKAEKENGSLKKIVVTIIDITHYQNIIEEQQQTINQLAQIQNALNSVSIISKTDSNGTITFINNTLLKISKYTSKELLGKNHSILNSGYHSKEFWIEFWKNIKEGKIWRGEIKNKAKDNSYYWVDTTIIPLYDSDGKITEYMSIRNDITNRKLAEEEQEKTKVTLNNVFNEMEEVLWSVSLPDYKVIVMSPSITSLYGIPYNDFINDNSYWIKAVYEEDKDVIPRLLEAYKKEGRFEEIYRIIDTKGKIKWIKNKGKVIYDEHGVGIRIDGYVSDVSELKFAEEKLRKSELNLKEAEKIAKIGRWELNLITNQLFWSDTIFEIWEIENKIENSTYQNFIESIHPEDREKVNKTYNESLYNKTPYTIEHRLLLPDGRIKWIEEKCRTDYNESGNPIRSVGVASDITRRKNKEAEINKLSKIAEQTVNGVIVTNEEGYVTWINKSFSNISGYTLEELKGKKPGDILQGPLSDKHEIERIRKLMQNRVSFVTEIINYHKNGTPYWVNIKCNPLLDENGNLEGYMAIEMDITREIKTKRLLKTVKEKLEQTSEVAGVGGWELDIDTQKLYWSDITKRILNVPQNFNPNLKNTKNIYTEGYSRNSLKNAVEIAIKTGKDFNLELEAITPENKIIWVELIGKAEIINGKPVRLFGTIRDVTEKKTAQMLAENYYSQITALYEDSQSSLTYASYIQNAILPDPNFLSSFYPENFVFYKPKDKVGGDFYWFNVVGNRLIVIVGDCTGHGVPGALLTAITTILLDKIIIDNEITEPNEILNQLDKKIITTFKNKDIKVRDGLEASVCSFSPNNLVFSGAKRSIFIRKNKEIIEIKGDKADIGGEIEHEKTFTNQHLNLQTGDEVYLFTDGIIDQIGGERNKKLMKKQLKQYLEKLEGKSMQEQKDLIVRFIKHWMNDNEQHQTDDILVIGIKV